jgi:hypothetical protein
MGKNGDTIQKVYDAFGTGDVPTVLGAMDEKIEWQEPEFSPYSSVVGPQSVVEGIFGPVLSDFPNFAATPSEIHDAGDVVTALGRYSGTSSATGETLDVTFAHVWHFNADGKIAKFRTYNDSLGWLKPLGKA